jgi:hypothetical protein
MTFQENNGLDLTWKIHCQLYEMIDLFMGAWGILYVSMMKQMRLILKVEIVAL